MDKETSAQDPATATPSSTAPATAFLRHPSTLADEHRDEEQSGSSSLVYWAGGAIAAAAACAVVASLLFGTAPTGGPEAVGAVVVGGAALVGISLSIRRRTPGRAQRIAYVAGVATVLFAPSLALWIKAQQSGSGCPPFTGGAVVACDYVSTASPALSLGSAAAGAVALILTTILPLWWRRPRVTPPDHGLST